MSLGVRRRPQGVDRGIYYRRQIDRLSVEPELARNYPRHIEHVVDQPRLQLGIAVDRLKCAVSMHSVQTDRFR